MAATATLTLLLTGCASGGSSADGGDEKIVLNMWGFADLSAPLVEKYEAEHPNIDIQSKISDYDAAHQTLLTSLIAGQGPDIAQIAVDYMGEFVDNSGAFTDLRDFGAEDLAGDYLDWRWKTGVASDGSVVAIPTDVGGMAIAYRKDLFAAAGLPTDRDEVSALWPDWQGYIDTGKKYYAATGKSFVDAGKAIYRAASNQADEKYYDADGNLIYEDNPAIRQAWDYSMDAIEGGLSADLATWSPEWLAGMSNGAFATIPAPAWLLSTIKQQAPDTEGQWDVATLPGVVGNDGGSFLAVPKASKHAKEAYDFITWLEAPEQQLALFEDNRTFPSTPSLYEDPAVVDLTDPFFSDAPLGEIYIDSVKSLNGYPIGPDSRVVEQQFEAGVGRVEQGQAPDESWNEAIEAAARETNG
ncbi:extracellular solute-binding protein [Herbiconiux sp. KACC 21604]|uniref:ABC transporter substrate-binding protein n=1 Tax=unclassified Herbiconiux TaxID=2618217 RepID=UPI001491A8AF|nr:extracellular solute-binding protein [Herbiconiux sp. SALV-R1]QJU55230.1 extracellular solute-binding protein [Herbiconiux sp. SALV-R1]WPO86396.1 extracellular solute-binding protein [Herbiconiux sp. KACC 21604]